MTTNNQINIRISADLDDQSATLVIERGGLAKLISFPAESETALHTYASEAVYHALNGLREIEAAPPPDIAIEDPKPAPAPAAKATPKKQTPAKPAPPPVKAKWWTNEDTGAVKRDDGPAMDTDGWLGPFDTEAEAESNIPDWLRSAFGGKSKSKKR